MTRDAKIYVNNASVARSRPGEAKSGPLPRETVRSQAHGLYSNTTEHPWNPVPRADVGAARAAVAGQYLDRPAGFQNSSLLSGFSQREMSSDEAASRHNVQANLVRPRDQGEVEFRPRAGSRKGTILCSSRPLLRDR